MREKRQEQGEGERTETCVGVAPALPALVGVALRTVRERLVLVADVVEEVDLLLLGEKRGGDTVHWCVAPALSKEYA